MGALSGHERGASMAYGGGENRAVLLGERLDEIVPRMGDDRGPNVDATEYRFETGKPVWRLAQYVPARLL